MSFFFFFSLSLAREHIWQRHECWKPSAPALQRLRQPAPGEEGGAQSAPRAAPPAQGASRGTAPHTDAPWAPHTCTHTGSQTPRHQAAASGTTTDHAQGGSGGTAAPSPPHTYRWGESGSKQVLPTSAACGSQQSPSSKSSSMLLHSMWQTPSRRFQEKQRPGRRQSPPS